jgi:hypothetical protein
MQCSFQFCVYIYRLGKCVVVVKLLVIAILWKVTDCSSVRGSR